MNRFSRLLVFLFFFSGLIASVLVPSAFPSNAAPSTQVGIGRMRFVNATVEGTPLTVYANQQLVAVTVEELVGYFTFNSGPYTIIFQNAGGTEIARADLQLETATRMTIALLGTADEPQIFVQTDDAQPPVRNSSRVQIVNAIVGSAPQPFFVDGEALFAPVVYGEVSAPSELIAGSYAIALGDPLSFNVVFEPRFYYLLFFIGNEDSVRLLEVPGESFAVSGTNRYRFVNLVEAENNAPIFDLYVNQAPIFTGVEYREATGVNVVAPGSNYTFDLYLTGSGPDQSAPVTSLTTPIATNQSLILIAFGTPEEVELLLFEDDLTPVPVNTSRLQIIHLSPAVTDFQVTSQNNITLFERVNFGSQVARNVPGGNYILSLADPDNPSQSYGTLEAVAPSGSLTTIIAFGSDRPRSVPISEPISQVAVVRVVHASPAAPTIDIYLNEDLILNNLSYQDFTDYLTLPEGTYEMTVYPDGITPESGTEPLWRDQLTITANVVAFTMVAFGTDNFRINSFPDNLEAIPVGQTRIRFIHGALNLNSLSVINAANSGVLVGGLAYGTGSSNLNVDAGSRTLNFNRTGEGTLYGIESIDLVAGGYYSFILIGDATQPETLTHLMLEVLP